MNEDKKHRVCPVERAGMLDVGLRRLLQSPKKILSPHVRDGMSVLDLGCGPGFFTAEMARLAGMKGRVVAADLQPGMLDKAREKIAAAASTSVVRFHLCRADALGLDPAEKFDFILVFYMLHEVPDPAGFLREIKSLLAPDGRVLLAEPRWHVTRSKFREAIGLMEQAGFFVLAEPAIRFSRTVLLGHRGQS
jgi:ubiquinone/menaquinone biosynthesis C-methylase UbiE